MWRIIRNTLAGVVLLVFLVWTGLLWAFLLAVPTWTYVVIAVISIGLVAFVRLMWAQNVYCDPKPRHVEYPPYTKGEEPVDAEVIGPAE